MKRCQKSPRGYDSTEVVLNVFKNFALGIFREIKVNDEPRKCWRCGLDIPVTDDRCTNCHTPISEKTLQKGAKEKGELENLKFELGYKHQSDFL